MILENKLINISAVKPYRHNARVGNLEVIKESLRRNQQYRPIVVWQGPMEVLAGNHTWMAARELGWDQVWATFVDCDEETAARINLVDNRAPELGAYNEEELVKLLGMLPALEGTGYTNTDVDRLSARLIMGVGGDTDPKPLPSSPETRRGDLYVMGGHRLLCGDSTNAPEVELLMGGERPVCMWTDPPYLGPGDNSGQGDRASPDSVSNTVDGLRQLLVNCFELANAHLADGAAIYVLHPGGANSLVFGAAWITQPWRLRQTLVWLKESMIMGYHDYHMQHELILDGEKADSAELVAYGFARKREQDHWYGDKKQCSVLEHSRPAASLTKLHPTIRPVGLIEQCVVNSTPKGGLIYDPFAGAGTTLVAAHNLGRRALIMELDPGYCDVIVDRWQRHTGNAANKLRPNDPDFVP